MSADQLECRLSQKMSRRNCLSAIEFFSTLEFPHFELRLPQPDSSDDSWAAYVQELAGDSDKTGNPQEGDCTLQFGDENPQEG